MNAPQISVVMPVYNAEKYLEEAIKSILSQTFTDFEFIIINDGSLDRSVDIIKSFADERISLINQQNAGVAKALNNGIGVSNAECIARMDADDVAYPDRLEKEFRFLKGNTDHLIIGGNADRIDMDGDYIHTTEQKTNDHDLRQILPSSPFIHPTVMFRKTAFHKAGMYPEYMYNFAEDLVLFNRMAQIGKIANLSDSLIKYRITPAANSTRSRKDRQRLNDIINEAILYNKIECEDIAFLKKKYFDRTSTDRLSSYHIYIAKKFLWNNYHGYKARQHLKSALRITPYGVEPYYLYLISYLGEDIIKFLYRILKV